MQLKVWNTERKRYEVIEFEATPENSTWFECHSSMDVQKITDTEHGLVISYLGDCTGLLVSGKIRQDVGYSQDKTRKLIEGIL